MKLNIPTSAVAVTLTKVAVRVRYDIPAYASGGLTWADVENKDGFTKDGYLVEKDGKVVGLAFKWDDGKWTGQNVLPGYSNPGVGYAFESSLRSGKTRTEVIAKILRWATSDIYGKY